jgi:hypothetical protein
MPKLILCPAILLTFGSTQAFADSPNTGTVLSEKHVSAPKAAPVCNIAGFQSQIAALQNQISALKLQVQVFSLQAQEYQEYFKGDEARNSLLTLQINQLSGRR